MVYSIKETINETVNQQAETPSNTKTKAVLNQAVADLSVAASIVHQVHWYMRGPGFLYLHPKMDELMDSLNAHLDVISERLITKSEIDKTIWMLTAELGQAPGLR